MAEDEEDWNGLEMAILKSFSYFFKMHKPWRSSLKVFVEEGKHVYSLGTTHAESE